MLKIVEATTTDAYPIAVLRHTVWEETYRGVISDELIDNFDSDFHQKKNVGIIADERKKLYKLILNGRLVGYFSFGIPTYACFSHNGIHLYSLYILEEFQGLGIGKTVIEYIEKCCKDEGKQFIYLTCNIHNHKAREFYTYMNFELLEERMGNGAKEEDQAFYQKLVAG